MGAPSLRIRLFGPLDLQFADARPQSDPAKELSQTRLGPGPRVPSAPSTLSFLAYVIVHHDRAIPRETLIGIFWSERTTDRARRALSHALWQARQVLGPAADRLVTEGDTVTFSMGPGDWLDVTAFEDVVEQHGSGRVHGGPGGAASLALKEAVDLYRSGFLEGCYDDWALVERERLRELYLQALERLVSLSKQSSDYNSALAYAQRLVVADPLREAAHRDVMRLYHLLGRPRAALSQYAKLCDLLMVELEAAPTPTTTALRREIAASLEEPSPAHLPTLPPPPPLLRELVRIPLVGRTQERSRLMSALQAASQGRGGAALVAGEPGVGKTRLVNDLVASARWQSFLVAPGKADPAVSLGPLHLLRSSLSPLLTPLRAAQLAEMMDPLRLAAVAPILPSVAEHVSQLPALPSLPPTEEQERLFRGMTDCIVALSTIAPLLVVLEDLQWADETTLEALRPLVAGIRASRVLLILTCRPVEAKQRKVVWETLDAVDREVPMRRLLVSPFDRSESISLVRRALGAAAEDREVDRFASRLHDKTGGNALFLVESLEAMLEQGVLTPTKGRWRLPTAAQSIALSSTLEGLVRRRLADVAVGDQSVLEHVAVLGKDADFQMLCETAGVAAAELARRLRQLAERGFLRETNVGYLFQHDIIRDVVYEGIPDYRRGVLHRKVGATLERLRPDSVESLAYHLERGEVWRKAVQAARKAGARARAVYAGAQAVEYYDRALSSWRQLPDTAEGLGLGLHRERGRIHQDLGHFEEAEADFRAALRLARHAGDDASLARIRNHLSYLRFQEGDFEGAAQGAHQALRLGVEAGLASEVAAARFGLANALRNLGDYREAIDLYQEAATTFEQLDREKDLADCLNRMGAAYNHIGDFRTARALIERSLAIRRRLRDRLGVSYSLINQALSDYYLGQFEGVRVAAGEALAIAEEIEDPYGQDAAIHDLGLAAVEQGHAAEAIPLFERSLAVAREIGDKALEPEVLAEMGRAYQQQGDLEKAQGLLEDALRAVSVSVEQNYVAALHAYLAELYLGMERDDLAREHAQAGLDEAQGRQDLWATGLTRRVMGQVDSRVEPPQVGHDPSNHFEESISVLREIGAEAELARSLVAYGRYLTELADVKDTRRAGALLEEARALCEKLGMQFDLARLEAVGAEDREPGRLKVRLAELSAPVGRTLDEGAYVEVTWTVELPQDEALARRQFPDRSPRVGRRHYRLLRLLRQAAEQSGAPTVVDLANALGVSPRTIKRDLAALRAEGQDVQTRGSRSTSG